MHYNKCIAVKHSLLNETFAVKHLLKLSDSLKENLYYFSVEKKWSIQENEYYCESKTV